MNLKLRMKSFLTRHLSDELKDQIKHTLLGVVSIGVPMVLLTNYTGSHPLTIAAIAVALASFGGVFEGYLVRQDAYERKVESVYDMWDADARSLRQGLKDWRRQNVLDTARMCELRTELEDARRKLVPPSEFIAKLDRKTVQSLSSDVYKYHWQATKGFREKVDELFPNEDYVHLEKDNSKFEPTHPDVAVTTFVFTEPDKTGLVVSQPVPEGILEARL